VLARAQRRARLESMYEFFPDLARQKSLLAGRLSGGQRQMLAVARALLVEPALLMLDEPSAGLSPKLVELVFAKLREIRQSGVTILLVEQNARAALAIADRGYVLAEGRNHHTGSGAALLADSTVAELYLGGVSRSDS
jgi:branched-chain amino acid transport system ATP-binding protein